MTPKGVVNGGHHAQNSDGKSGGIDGLGGRPAIGGARVGRRRGATDVPQTVAKQQRVRGTDAGERTGRGARLTAKRQLGGLSRAPGVRCARVT